MNACVCGSGTAHCTECGTLYEMGTRSHCPRPRCAAMNAPLDCDGCSLVVSSDLDGVLTLEGKLLPWKNR